MAREAPKSRRQVLEVFPALRQDDRRAPLVNGRDRLVLATGRYVGEGLDDARLDTLSLALPIAWKGTVVQYTGRLSRLHPQKTQVRIYDYVDGQVPICARMYEKRLRGYRALGYGEEGR